MDKKNSKVAEKEKPNWDWTHVQCYLKTTQHNRRSTIWNLSPGIILTNPSTETSGPSVRLYIDTEKSLQYSQELGWNWHKSWNIPNISLRLEIKDQNTGDFLLAPRNLYAQIFAVKKNAESDKLDRTTLVDVGIRGQSKMEMIDGQVYFSAIKFSSTTYNNQGVNFNLLIVLYINQGQFEKPKVLTAVISPAIFVDSRRSARDYQQKKFSSFVEPFAYDTLDKEFIKRENKSKCENEILIKNDPEGFYNYITAPNIRHKVKHPVFLALKFSNCVKLYFNDKLVFNTQANELLENLQTRLLKENKNKQKNDVELATNLEEKYFVFVISNLTDSLKRKKVIESIETMQNQFIGIACGNQELPQFLRPFHSLETLKKAYKESYDALMAICQNYQPEEQDESEDYGSNQYEDSSRSEQKKKEEAPPRTRNKTTIISNKKEQAEQSKVPKIEKNEEILLKKEELFEPQFQAPVFLNNDNPEARKPVVPSSAFSKAVGSVNSSVGFRNVNNSAENNPIFDTSQLNKAFSNNLANPGFNQSNRLTTAFKTAMKDPSLGNSQSNANSKPLSTGQGNLSLGQGLSQGNQPMAGTYGLGNSNSGFNNAMYNNLLMNNMPLQNYMGNVKNNNNGGLFDNLLNPNLSELVHKGFGQGDQSQKLLQMSRQSDDQQSILCLMQQVGLYKQLLAQISYQNQLLARDINIKQQGNINPQFGSNSLNMNYMNLNNMGLGMDASSVNSNMNNINPMSGLGNMNNLNNLNNMNNLNSLGGMNNLGNLQNMQQTMLNSNLLNNQMNLLQAQQSQTSTQSQNQATVNSSQVQPPVQNSQVQPQVQQVQPQVQQVQPQVAQVPQTPQVGQVPQVPQVGQAPQVGQVSQVPQVGGQPQGQAQGTMNPQGQMVRGDQPKEELVQMQGQVGLQDGQGGITSSNYEIIKNMVLQDLKRQAEQKQRERQDN